MELECVLVYNLDLGCLCTLYCAVSTAASGVHRRSGAFCPWVLFDEDFVFVARNQKRVGEKNDSLLVWGLRFFLDW